MKTAAFRLDNYIFDRVSLDLSNLKPETTFNIDFIPSGKFFADKDQYELTFVFAANQAETNEPVVNVRCVAQFSFRDLDDDKNIPVYFYTNAIAILFPYVRAMVSTLTLQANATPMVLPTLNLSDLKDVLKEHTTRV